MTATQSHKKSSKTSSKKAKDAAPKADKAAYRPGAFVWLEVRTPTPEKTAKLLSSVVGWEISTLEMVPGQPPYTMGSTKSGPVAGIVPVAAGERAELVGYLSVDDVDAAAKRVAKAGGTVKGAPFDVPTIGRMVEVADPEGAAFFLFKSENGDAALPPAPGAVLWSELWSKNASQSVAFFTSVVGYSVDSMEMNGSTYHVFKKGDAQLAGVMKSPVAELPQHFLTYLQVDDVEAALARAKKLSCALEGEVMEVQGIGRFAFLRAPDGCRFAVMTAAAK